MKNSLTGNALKMFKAIEEAVWSYASDVERTKSGELADVPLIELLPGLLYYAAEVGHLQKLAVEDLIEMLRHAWTMREYDNAKSGPVNLQDVVGRTVASIDQSTAESPHGAKTVVTLHFTDGTHHGFILPKYKE